MCPVSRRYLTCGALLQPSRHMPKKVTLYAYWRSSCSWRVRIALATKDVQYEYKVISVSGQATDNKSAEFTKLNPMQQVPCLVVSEEGKPDVVINQSLAIIEYIDTQFEGPSLYPTDAADRAFAQELALDVAAGTQPLQNPVLMDVVGQISNDEQRSAWGTKWITKGLDALEAKAQARLASYPSTAYLVGAEPTVADACLIPQLYNARRFNVPLDPYRFPRLLAVEKALAVLPAFVAAHANNQPDAEL